MVDLFSIRVNFFLNVPQSEGFAGRLDPLNNGGCLEKGMFVPNFERIRGSREDTIK